MITLLIHYTFEPDAKCHEAWLTYTRAEDPAITRAGGRIVGYFGPTTFAGPTNQAYGLIDFDSLAAYERYRDVLDNDPAHQANVAALERSGARARVTRSILRRVEAAT